jgi:hypothetical protein
VANEAQWSNLTEFSLSAAERGHAGWGFGSRIGGPEAESAARKNGGSRSSEKLKPCLVWWRPQSNPQGAPGVNKFTIFDLRLTIETSIVSNRQS